MFFVVQKERKQYYDETKRCCSYKRKNNNQEGNKNDDVKQDPSTHQHYRHKIFEQVFPIVSSGNPIIKLMDHKKRIIIKNSKDQKRWIIMISK